MTLDKQQILNDLGNVMNQLQGANCGCMGKIFSNPSQDGNAMRPKCCHNHGYCYGQNSPCAHSNEPCSRAVMGRCNPRKLYADTYSYLSKNLMQPVVQGVHQDLKSLTPDNTIASNPLAHQMGLTSNNSNIGDTGHNMSMNSSGLGHQIYSSPESGAPSMMNQHQVMQSVNPQQAGNMAGNIAGAGPQIVGMYMGDSGDKAMKNPAQEAHENVANMGQYNNTANNVTQGSPVNASYPVAQYHTTQPNNIYQTENMYSGMQAQNANRIPTNNNSFGGSPTNQMISNPTAQKAAYPQSSHGVHSPGITKFNEMFPGVMKNDLGFDPMLIAMQMNPANQQKSAINNMTKLMNDNKFVSSPNRQSFDNSESQNLVPCNQQNILPTNYNRDMLKEQVDGVNPNLLARENQQQLVCSATTDGSMQQQLAPQQQTQQSHLTQQSVPVQNIQYQQLQNLPPGYENIVASNKETISPVDTSKNNQYNTFGHLVEKFPAKMFHVPEPLLPQTLSPLPNIRKPMQYSNVKSTVSKTSIVGEKPVRSQSKSQLQHIYNQYKGSQSYTQQNIPSHGQGATSSERTLNIRNTDSNPPRQVPVEKVGGDSMANNATIKDIQPNNEVMKPAENKNSAEKTMLEASKPGGDIASEMTSAVYPSKVRNGLQDIVQSKYTYSAGWSFHGTGR